MKALIVDDHAIARTGLVQVFRDNFQSATIYVSNDEQAAMRLCIEHSPEIAVIDLSISGALCFGLIKDIATIGPKTPVLVLSMHQERDYAERTLKAGAKGYVMKGEDEEILLQAIRFVLSGGTWLSEPMRNSVLQQYANGTSASKFQTLSDREMEVFSLMGNAYTKSQIAKKLGLSVTTVETYRMRIREKLGATTGPDLYQLARLHVKA